jgi:rhodanese-related sulfurtransferase
MRDLNIFFDDWKKIYDENNKNLIVIDTRTKEEYESGHVKNSINIDFFNPNLREELNKLDKNKIYLLYCRSGSRSEQVGFLMKEELGFKEVYNLIGGVLEWLDRGEKLV